NVTVSGSTVTVNPTADLAQGTGYYVEIAAGAIKDLAGNNYAGTTGATTWNFTTADTTAPTVTTFTPVNNATTVAVTANAVVAFSEAVQKGTGNIVIKKVSDNSVVETINVTSTNVTISGSTVTIDPTNNLADNTQYYVEIATSAIKDLAGNNYSGITNTTDWNFTNTDSKIDNSTELDAYLTNKGINVSGAVESVLSELIAKVNPLTVEYQNNELTVTYDGEVDFSKFADLPHLPLVNKITADLTIPISEPSLTISELNSPTPTYKLGGKVNFEEEKDSGKPNVLDFINEQLKIKEIELETEVNTSKGELSVTANLSTEKLTLLKVDPLWIELTDATFNINTTTTSTPKFGIGGSVSITGYDPFQDNEPELNVSADIIFQPESITSKLKLAPTQTWKNPFGLPDSEIRNFTIQLGGTYAPPWIDNVGFMGDLKFGNFDIQAAFAVDSNDPKKFAVELTANNPINIVDLWAGPVGSYLIKQVGKEVGFVKTAEGFLKEVLDLNIKSIDGNADKILDPLLKLVPFNTEIGETKLTKGFGINGQINLWGKDVILSLNANPYDVINPSLNGSLKIDEIDWGFLKLTGADGDNDKTLDLTLKVDTTEQYLKGDGKLEVFGETVAKANFEITPTSVKVKDYDLNLGVVALDVNDFSLDVGNKTASGSATLKLLGNEIAAVQINTNEKNELKVKGNIDLFGVLSIDATIDVKKANEINITGKAKIFGQNLEDASISIKDNKLNITGGIGYDIPEIGNVGATLTITSDGRPSSSQMAVSFSAGPLGGVQYTIDLAPLRSIEDVFDQAIGKVLGVVTEAVNKAIDGVVTGFNTVSSAVLDTFDQVGKFLKNPVEGAIEFGKGIYLSGDNVQNGLGNGNDFFDAKEGNDKVWGNGGNDWLIGGSGEDYLSGDEGNDKLEGSSGNDSLRGGSGNDQLFGQQEQDTLYGDDGNDLLDGGESGDFLYGGAGNDLLDGGPGNDGDDLNGDDGNDKLQGRNGNDILRGGSGDDLLYGDEGNDQLYGGEGTDFLIGGDGDDLLAGWKGNDRLNGDQGNDTLLGEDGNDELDGYQGNDSLDGGNGNDVLYGQGDNDFLRGGDGDDALYGEDNGKQGGHYDGSHDNDTLEGGNGKDQLFGGVGDDFLSGGNDNDILSGEAGNDKLNGDGGDDFLDGGDGNDSLNGGSDNDTLFGRGGNDFLEGFGGNDYLYGGDGEDKLYSHEGDDILKGEAGNDYLYGWTGNDLLDGGDGNDSLYGEGDNDTLSGGNGSNVLDGGNGIDVADYRFATGAVEARLTNGEARFSGNLDKFISIENIIGSANNDTLAGDAQNNTLSGQAGDDKLFGESGNDQLNGEQGNDELHGWEGNDTLYGGAGNDTLYGQQGDDNIQGGEGNDALYGEGNGSQTGSSSNDTLSGGGGDDALYGGEGNDYLDGGAGNDTIDGGAGNDILLLTGKKEDYQFTETATGWRIVAPNGDVKIVTGIENFEYKPNSASAITEKFTTAQVRTYYKTRVIDGYIGSGKVFFDANLNGMLDEAEPFTITRADGSIDLNVDIEKFDINKNGELDYTEGQFVLMGGMDIIGGVDAATGLPMATPLTSTLASTVVTPLTTAIASMVQQGLDPATAEAQVKSALGLPAGVDLGSYDPLEAIANGDTNGVSVFGSMILVQNTIVQTAKFIEGVSETAVAQLAFSGIGAIANQLKGGAAVDLGKTETILAILQGAITKAAESDPKINPTQLVASAAAASQIMALGNQIVKDVLASGRPIKDIALDITKLQAVSVGQIAVGLSDLAAGTVTVEDFLAQNSQEAILARMETVKVNDPTVRPVVETIALKDASIDPLAPTSDGTGTTPVTDTPTSTTA
ncbi:MAG: Ig-like domain-containing protein, partial [Microcoleus sp.]